LVYQKAEKANKSLHWIFTPLRSVKTSEFNRWCGRFAPHHRAAYCHPLSVMRFAPDHQADAADIRPHEQARESAFC